MQLLRYFYPKSMNKDDIINLISSHSNIKFCSLVAVDLGNNHTDEKIPIKLLLDDFDSFIKNGVQTDGSSVNLPLIATINNARVDIIPDLDCKWIIDYNEDNLDRNNNPIGTLMIPSFLKHNDLFIDSRSVLKRAISNFKKNILDIFNDENLCKYYNISSVNDIEDVLLTTATELEFWVKTPDDSADVEALSTSQLLKEQYWKRTVGPVRTALENSLIMLDEYGYKPEMAHKEVGGIKSKLSLQSDKNHIMEQLEIDWSYFEPIECADNEMFAKNLIADIFRLSLLDVSFDAKPIESVAGSGEHHHIGVGVLLKNKKFINLFSSSDMNKSFLSSIGYGALMGMLKNYEIINPFVTSSYDAFNRLKPGFEAPVCTVASLGLSPSMPSRNRTVLICVVRDIENSKATRFELRSPNPKSNSYLTLASVIQAMLDGIKYSYNKNENSLYTELSKKYGEKSDYLEQDRLYISEDNVYEKYDNETINKYFGKAPRDVYELLKYMEENNSKLDILKDNDVFNDEIINSYKETILTHWVTELRNRILHENETILRSFVKLHNDTHSEPSEKDLIRWEEIRKLKWELMKHNGNEAGLFDKLRIAIEENNYKQVSDIQYVIMQKMSLLNSLYLQYKHKLL